MNLTLKILAGTAFVLLSTVGVAPVKAQSSATPMESQTQQSEMQQSEMQSRQVGTIQSISGSTAVVEMKDGTTQEIPYSAESMDEDEASQLAPGSYVLINDGQIEGVAYKGTIRNITGAQAEVELENGELEPIDVTRAEIGAYNLIEGTPVYIYSDQIVDTASPVSSESTPTQTESMNNSDYDSQSDSGMQNSTETTPDTSTYDSQPDSQESTGAYDSQPGGQENTESDNSQSDSGMQNSTGTTPDTSTYDSQSQDSTGTYESQTNTQTQDSTGTYESQTNTQTQDSTETYESQPDTTESTTEQEAQEPVRGMW
jgi:hypothetical protein